MNNEALEQQKLVIEATIAALAIKSDVTLKAPTGSGKTVMLAHIMDKMIKDNKNLVFIVTTLSKADLDKQNHETFYKWSKINNILTNINPFHITTDDVTDESGIQIPTDYNVYSLNDGKIKFANENGNGKHTLLSRGPFASFLRNLITQNKKVIWIKDECHREYKNFQEIYEGNKKDGVYDWQFAKKLFIKRLNVSATPKTTKCTIDVELSEHDACMTKLIKELVCNNGMRNYGEGKNYEEDKYKELRDCLRKFKEIKKQYISNNIHTSDNKQIMPCLIIQIDNKEKGETELEHLKNLLNNKDQNINWVYLCDDRKSWDSNSILQKLKRKANWEDMWIENVKSPDSYVDVIIFKMMITEGWDIPRANMLFQIRDTKSSTLTEQVVGRIKRNPILENWDDHTLEAQSVALKAYVWGKIEDKDRKFKRVKLLDNIPKLEIKTTTLKNLQRIEKATEYLKKVLKSKEGIEDIKPTIFELANKWDNVDSETKKICWNNIESYNDWFKISRRIDEIDLENKRLLQTYDDTIEINEVLQQLTNETYFEVLNSDMKCEIRDNDKFSWKIISNKTDEEFFFDSKAEVDFANILKRISKKVWARNYYANSKIGYEYINVTKKTSYPDFILLDNNNKMHIFEVKSLNYSNEQNINKDDYKNKIKALAPFYNALSKKIKNYIFYLPINKNNKWYIYKYENGNGIIKDDEIANEMKYIDNKIISEEELKNTIK